MSHEGVSEPDARRAEREDEIYWRRIPDPKGHHYFEERCLPFWYSQVLAKMREPSLRPEAHAPDADILRFLRLSSHIDLCCIRVWRDGSEYCMRDALIYNSMANGMGVRVHDHFRMISAVQWEQIQEMVLAKDFWKPLSAEENSHLSGLDGTDWLFERLSGGVHTYINLWHPMRSGPYPADWPPDVRDPRRYGKLGMHLMRLAGREV